MYLFTIHFWALIWHKGSTHQNNSRYLTFFKSSPRIQVTFKCVIRVKYNFYSASHNGTRGQWWEYYCFWQLKCFTQWDPSSVPLGKYYIDRWNDVFMHNFCFQLCRCRISYRYSWMPLNWPQLSYHDKMIRESPFLRLTTLDTYLKKITYHMSIWLMMNGSQDFTTYSAALIFQYYTLCSHFFIIKVKLYLYKAAEVDIEFCWYLADIHKTVHISWRRHLPVQHLSSGTNDDALISVDGSGRHDFTLIYWPLYYARDKKYPFCFVFPISCILTRS